MSITNSLKIVTDLTPAEVVDFLLREQIGLTLYSQDRLKATGFHAGIGIIAPDNQITYQEWFGFRPTLAIHFHMDLDEDIEKGHKIIGLATAALLKKEPGDAVLLFNGSVPFLTRVKGHIVLNKGMGKEWLIPPLHASNLLARAEIK